MLPGQHNAYMNSLVSLDDYYGHPKPPVLPTPPRGTMPHPSSNPHVKLATAPDPKEIQVEKRKRKTSVEGNNIGELVANIIKDEPGITLVRKAIKKMAGFVEDKNEENMAFDI